MPRVEASLPSRAALLNAGVVPCSVSVAVQHSGRRARDHTRVQQSLVTFLLSVKACSSAGQDVLPSL